MIFKISVNSAAIMNPALISDAADKFKQFANSILPYDIETTRQINIEEY